MLTRLRVQNFKGWVDSGEIRLAPLTVLFGANSAGKSSVSQLLALLKQTAESSDRLRALHIGDSRTLVDLGTYDDIVHNHEIGTSLNVEITWTLGDELVVVDPLSQSRFAGDAINFTMLLEGDKRHQPVVKSFTYQLLGNSEAVLSVGMTSRDGGKFDLSSSQYRLVRHAGRVWPLPVPLRFYGFPDETTAHYQNAAFTSGLVLELERMLRSIYYVGPLREYPRRLYLWSGEVPDHVGIKGERGIEAILAATAGGRSFNFLAKQRTRRLDVLVAERLRDMHLISGFEVHPLGEHRNEYEVLVQTNASMPPVKLTDVGFGVSQVLPVIVECFYVPPRSIVIFEQPEIHLHPRAQAELADLFVDAVIAREGGEHRGCQFIVESHSEHFLRRLQRRIAEERLSTDQTALYFLEGKADGDRISELDVDQFGNICNWPQGFFGDEMEDLVARAEAQARRLDQPEAG